MKAYVEPEEVTLMEKATTNMRDRLLIRLLRRIVRDEEHRERLTVSWPHLLSVTSIWQRAVKGLATANNWQLGTNRREPRGAGQCPARKFTLSDYGRTSRRFLSMLRGKQVPTRAGYNSYFEKRRKQDISERTLQKEFAHIKVLASANGWQWPFNKRDRPQPEDEPEHDFLSPRDIEQLILAQDKLSKEERFYLAVATTWIVRRVELSRIKKRDFDDERIILHTAKHGRKVKALIPDVLQPIFQKYSPKEMTLDGMSKMFRRICVKARLRVPPRTGWHAIRYVLNTVLNAVLPKNRLHPGILSSYAGWARTKQSDAYGGSAMMGYYHRPEILDSDPYGVFKVIYEIHPFLKVWKQVMGRKRPAVKSSLPTKGS